MDRIEYFARLAAQEPQEPRARYGYANELLRAERWDEAVDELRAYLAVAEDQGNAYGRLATALRRLGRVDEAADAYLAGIDAAERNGHHDMAREFQQEIESL
jgi:predicted Zn-dependent protease